MAVVGEPMEKFVLNQIETRQKFAGKKDRDNKHHKFTTSRTAWIKLASGVTLKSEVDGKKGSNYGGGLKFPKKYVLFNGTSKSTEDGQRLRSGIGYEKSYDTSDTDFGVVPMPGIFNASIKSLNRGSIKKATVKIKANSRRQFEIIDELYLRVGYTMMLEWGWTHYLIDKDSYDVMGPTIIDKDWFKLEEAPGPPSYWLQLIRDERRYKQGNYDAMFAKVVNFKWDFNEDGTYDIELFLISHGDVIESLRTLPSNTGASQIKWDEETDRNALQIYWADKGVNILKFSKDSEKKILKNASWHWYTDEESLNVQAKTIVLDTVDVRDKLTEYLFAVSMFGVGLFSNLNVLKITKDDNPDTNYYGGESTRKRLPWWIDGYTAQGLPEQEYDMAYLMGSGGIYSGYRIGVSNKQVTQTGIGGLFSFSPAVDRYSEGRPKAKIVESIVMFDGGFNVRNEEKMTISSFKQNNKIYNPNKDPQQRSYIRLGNLLKALETFSIPFETQGQEPIVRIQTNESIPLYIAPGENGYQDYLSTKVQSLKPSTILLGNVSVNFDDVNPDELSVNDSRLSIYGDIEYAIDEITVGGGKTIPFVLGENIYISIPYLMGIIPISKNDSNQTRLNLYSFLKDICQEINKALGSINNLEPVLDENTNTLRLQDSTNFPYRQQIYEKLGLSRYGDEDIHAGSLVDETLYQPIQVYGYRSIAGSPVASFVRKIDLQTKISKELATIATVGATAGGGSPTTDATALSRFNVGKIDRFAEEYTFNTTEEVVTPKTWKDKLLDLLYENNDYNTRRADCSMVLGYQAGSLHTGLAGEGEEISFNNGNLTMDSSVQETNQTFFAEYYRYCTHKLYKNADAGSPQLGFLPFEFSLDMDGLSGVKIYNKINIDTSFLPSNYPKALEFVIKGVEHSLKGNDWETKLVTIAVPRTADQDVPTSSDVDLDEADSLPPDGDNSGPSPSPDKCDCGCEGPGGAQNMIGTWNNSKKKKLINYSGTEIWPIMGWDDKKVFWEDGKPYALPKPGRKAKRNKYKKNPQFTALLTSWSHQGRNFKMLNITSPVTGLTLQQSINKTLDSLKSQGLLNSTFAFIDGTNVVSRDVGGTTKTKLCNNRGRLSGHAFAIALDINSDAYPWGSSGMAKWKKFLKWWEDGDAAAGASLTYEEKMKGKVIYVFSRINHNGDFLWTQGVGFSDPHHFTLNGWIM